MLVSVVVPFYREINLIAATVDSVIAQQGLPEGVRFEICIGNDGAHSNEEILSAIAPQHRQCVRIANNSFAKGPGGARNTGIALSAGDLIAFLDADDRWLPEKVSLQLRAIAEGCTFVAGAYRFDGRITVVTPPKRVTSPLDVFWRQGIGTSTVLMRRDLLGESRFRDFRFSQDIDFWYQIAQKPGFVYAGVEQPVTTYSTGGSTKNKLVQAKSFWNVMRYNQVPVHLCAAVLSRYAARGIFNHYLSGQKAANG
jgi:teichuronic acid biosynthesis glycosyltransferase TuaG